MRATLDQVIHVDIRPIAADELTTVQKTLPPEHPEAHVRRLADQRSGRVTYLVAWHEGRALGHVLVRWGGTTDPELVWKLGRPVDHPYVEALFVHPHTLAYRLRRCERLLGVNLKLPESLLRLQLAFMIRDVMQA